MLLGYARVSTKDQNLNLQLDDLRLHGCERFFTDTVSGAKSFHPGLDEILQEAHHKNVIVIWKIRSARAIAQAFS